MMGDLMDDDGENRALRYFLAHYGANCGLTVASMKANLRMAGFNGAWPAWCNEPGEDGQHLTKGGAQLWIRHLLSLEPAPQAQDKSDNYLSGYCTGRTDLLKEQSAQPVAQPLTLEQILDIVKKLDETPDMSHVDVLKTFARAIEAAHGIREVK